MAKRRAVSPTSTSGAGTIFEYWVAAIMLVHLLRGSHPPGLQVPLAELGLQQRVRGHLLDDVVVYGEGRSPCTEFQVKRTVTVTASDHEFVDMLSQALQVLKDREELVTRGELAVGLIARGNAPAMDELESLTEWAQGHASYDSLAEVFVPEVVNEKLRSRRRHVEQAVRAASDLGAPDLGGVERTAHQFLRALQVWRPAVGENGADFLIALDRLQPIADEFGVIPVDLFSDLVSLAESWGPVAGVVVADDVRRRLRWRGRREISVGASPALRADKIDADAVIRGPLAALNLQPQVDKAETLLREGMRVRLRPSPPLPTSCGGLRSVPTQPQCFGSVLRPCRLSTTTMKPSSPEWPWRGTSLTERNPGRRALHCLTPSGRVIAHR